MASLSRHGGPVEPVAALRAVIARDDDERLRGDTRPVKRAEDPPDVRVKVRNHPVETGSVFIEAALAVGVRVLVGHLKRHVRGIGGETRQKRPVALSMNSIAASANTSVQ
jgi:hypothetical protein